MHKAAGEAVKAQVAAANAEVGRGRHPTAARELVRLPGGALLIDSPGMRELQQKRFFSAKTGRLSCRLQLGDFIKNRLNSGEKAIK